MQTRILNCLSLKRRADVQEYKSHDQQPKSMAASSADSNPLSICATIDSRLITRLGNKVYTVYYT